MFFRHVAVVAFVLSSLINSAYAADTKLSRDDVSAIVKETLMNEPEIIMNALEKLRTQKAEKAQQDTLANIEKYRDDIFNNPNSPTIGQAKADVTIVEFYDYHCGYCKHFLPTLTKYMEEDKNVRVVFKEFPILSEDSVTAAKAALAVNRINPKKFFEFHTALMQEKGKFDEPRLLEIGKKVGVNPDKLKAEMAKPEVAAILDKNRTIAEKLNINGTPAVIIGDKVYPGAMPYEELKKAIEEARANKKSGAKKGDD